MVFVTHDVGVAVEVADRIAAMCAGRCRDRADRGSHPLAGAPLHRRPALVDGARCSARATAGSISGSPPDMTALLSGCSFVPRCRFAEPRRQEAVPPEFALAQDRTVRCGSPLAKSSWPKVAWIATCRLMSEAELSKVSAAPANPLSIATARGRPRGAAPSVGSIGPRPSVWSSTRPRAKRAF